MYGDFNHGQFFNYKRKEKELREEITDLKGKLDNGSTDKRSVNSWLEKLKTAWLSKDLTKVEILFNKTTQYFETPFEEPKTNIEDILKLWDEVKEQTIKTLSFKVLALEKHRETTIAVVEWNLELVNPLIVLNGVYEIKFRKTDCVYFKQWTV